MTAADHANTVREALTVDPSWVADISPTEKALLSDLDKLRAEALAALDVLQAQAAKAVWLEDELDECDKRADRAEARYDRACKDIGRLQAERDRLRFDNEALRELPSREMIRRAERLADALRDVQKRIPVWGQGMTDTDWRDAHRVLKVVRAALARTEQP